MSPLDVVLHRLEVTSTSLLFSTVFRLFVLRTLVILSAINLVISASTIMPEMQGTDAGNQPWELSISTRWLACSAYALVHVFSSLVRSVPCIRPFYIAAFGGGLYMQWTAAWKEQLLPTTGFWETDKSIILLATAHAQLYLYTVLTLLAVASVIRVGFIKYVFSWEVVDPLQGCNNHTQPYSRWTMVFGNALVHGRPDLGEGKLISVLRKLIAIIIFGVFLIMIGYSLIINPIRGSWTKLVKTYTVYDLPQEMIRTMEQYEWNVHILSRQSLAQSISSNLNVEPQWKEKEDTDSWKSYPVDWAKDIVGLRPIAASNCTARINDDSKQIFSNVAEQDGHYRGFAMEMSLFSYNCPSRFIFQDDARWSDQMQAALWGPLYLTSPDLVVTMNWTDTTTDPEQVSGRDVSLLVVVGMTKDTTHALYSTAPVHLSPGSHLIVNVVRRLRRVYQRPGLSAFGAPSFWNIGKMKTFMIAEVASILPNPNPPTDASGPEMSSLRIQHQHDVRNFRIEEDYIEGSLADGLAELGGLWTMYNVVFTFLFGGSLAMTLFAIKYFSPWGLIHWLDTNSLRKGYEEAYPRIQTEGGEKYQADAGFIAFLREYAFDIRHLNERKEVSE
ncbi:hypothetical protein AX16_007007 [Volvariella volvacea WC 439]|nr:hypothetical protein AX16_007007 [Volvariella volvacea WC 439]